MCYCVVKKLELSSDYFGRWCKIKAEFKTTRDVSWKLQTVYCKLKMYCWKLKMVYWKLKTMENQMTFSVLCFLHRMIWLQTWLSYSHLNKSWQNEVFHCNDLIWYHIWPIDVLVGSSNQMSAWPEAWPNVNLTQNLIFGWRGTCDVYYFYTHLELCRLIYLFILLFFTCFSLGVLGIAFGWSDMTWQISPTCMKGISLKCSKTYFAVHFILYPPTFFNMVTISGIDIHLKFTYPYHCYLHVKHLDGCASLHINVFFTYFCLVISEGDALLVTYISCKFYIFLRSTAKHYMCSAKKSDIVWCEISRSYCYFNRHGYQNPTAVL